MPVVTNTIKTPGGNLAAGRVTITLVGSNAAPVAGYVTATDFTVWSPTVVQTVAGVWSATLTANTLINPSGTRYKIVETVDGADSTFYVTVPNGAGPYFVEDILDVAPTAVGEASLTALDTRVDALESGTTRAGGTTPVSAKLPFFNIKDYGAVSDGVTNETAIVNSTLALLPASGAQLVIPENTVWVPTSSTVVPATSVVWDYSSSLNHPRVWGGGADFEFEIVGSAKGATENGNAGYLVLINSETNVNEPHAPGFVARFGLPDTDGQVLGGAWNPYNLWQWTYGNWANITFAATVSGGTTLTATAPQFVAGDVGRRIKISGVQTTIAGFTSSTVVTLTATYSNGAKTVGFHNADDMVLYAWQPDAVYGTATRTAPTVPGRQQSRLILGQNGVWIFNPAAGVAEQNDPLTAINNDYFYVFNPGGASNAGSTTRVLFTSAATGGAVGFDFWTFNGNRKKRMELVDATGFLRIRNQALSATIWEIDDQGQYTDHLKIIAGKTLQVDVTTVVKGQQAAVADATDAASAITQLNLLLARLRASTGHGLISG